MQYRRFKQNYILSMTPVTFDNMSIIIQKIVNGSLKTLSEVLPDADALSLKAQFEAATSEVALDTWYAARLTAISSAL